MSSDNANSHLNTTTPKKPGETTTKITRSTIESQLKNNKVSKHVKLEAAIQYIDQIKHEPVDFYMKESRSLVSLLLVEFEGDNDYFLLWVRFLDIAHVHQTNQVSEDQEKAFKKGIENIVTGVLLKDKKVSSIDWRIARKMLSLSNYFSLVDDSDLKHVEKGILNAFKAEIDIALDHLLWLKESLLVSSAKTTLITLRQCFESPADQDRQDLLEAVLCGRFDKEKFNLKYSLIMGEDGGLYLLLNRMNQQQQDALVAEQIVTRDYLKDKIKAKNKGKGDKIVLGTGGFGTVRFALSLLRSRSLPAEIVCVKKTKSFQDLGGSYKPTPLEQVFESTFGDYFSNGRAQAIYSPFILDMTFVTNRKVIKDDEKDHRKGYLMMEILPQNTATRIFADERYQKWEYQKPYLLDVLENTQKLLESHIAMTDLKPDNTLKDVDTRKATIIDLGGSIKVAGSQDLFEFDITKYSFQSTPEFRAPELSGSQGVINLHKALAFSCGKVIEAVTHKSDYDQQEITQIIKKLTASEPEARISIPEAISEIKRMGDDSYKKNVIFSHYINKVKDRLENKKSAISINEDIDKTRELFIPLKATSLDPSKYKDLKTEDLFKKIDDFLASGNPKQVMAIFAVAGSGKSIALQLKFIQDVYAWEPGQPLPIYFNLANGLDLDQIVRNLNTELDTNLSLKDLNRQHLYVDSFDEGLGIEDKKETLIKEYFRKLGSPKILITCRTDYLQDNWYDWFTPESKELEVCYVAPINYNGHQDLPNMVEKYVSYSNQHNSIQHTTEDYLKRLEELQLIDLINTGFMFVLILEVLFQLEDKKEGRTNKADIYAKYISHYQNSQISLKNQDQKNKLAEMTNLWKNNQADLSSFAIELGKYLACQMHLEGQSRLDHSSKLFAAFGYDSSLLFKYQSIIHLLKLLPLKIMTSHSGKRLISNQEIKIGFIHETIKNYYLLEAIKSEIEREGKSLILSSKSIIHDSEFVKLIVLAMKDNTKLTSSFIKAIENSKQDKSTPSIIYANNSISLLVAAQHSFSESDLSNIAVRGANIANGIFHNANLENADLSGVDMSNVNIIGASLNGADMRGVKFSIFPDLVGHTDEVRSVSFSPDGQFLASGSGNRDTTIKIWNPSTGECLQTLNGHTGGVSSVSFSPDGKFLASGSKDNTIKIWNPSTGECLQTLNGHTGAVYSVSFSPDGKFLASGSGNLDKTIKIWNPSTGECLQTLNGHTNWVANVSFSPDGKFLASGSSDKTIKIWNPSTGECLQTLTGHTDNVLSVSFSPDGKFLASGSDDKTIKIWNPSTGECLQTLNGHTDLVCSVGFSPDGKFLASGSGDKTIKIWNPSTGECLQTLNGHTAGVSSVSFSPDGKFLASGEGYPNFVVKIWNPSTGECLQTLNGHTGGVSSVSFSPDGKFLASGSSDTTIKTWNPSTGECLQTLNGHTGAVYSVSFSPDGKFLASGSGNLDKTIKIWNPSTGECLQTLNGHTNGINSVSFSPDGKFLASGSSDKTIKIWNSSTGECLQTLNGHIGDVCSVSFSPDGKFLASGSWDDTIKIWNPSTGECLQTLNRHTTTVCSVSFSPDGKFLASGSKDNTIKIWNPSTGECLQTLNGHTNWVTSVSFSPDGKFLASGSGYDDKTIKIWNPSTGECLQTLQGHTDLVCSVSFSPDGKFLASGSPDKTIKIFEFKATINAWLSKRNITATPSPLLADGATLKETRISHNHRLILTQKGADTKFSVIDNTINEIQRHREISSESHHTANQLSHVFLEKFVAHHQNQDSKLVTLSVTQPVHSAEIHLNISGSNPYQQSQNSKLVTFSEKQPPVQVFLDKPRLQECRSKDCCQIFAMPKIIYDNPLLNYPLLFTQISQTLGPVQALKLSNMQTTAPPFSSNNTL